MRILTCVVMRSVFVVGLAQCGCSSGASSPDNDCVVATVRDCIGPGACAGEQMCSGDGKEWSGCVCKGTVKPDAATSDTASTAEAHYVLVDDMEGTVEPNGPIHIAVTDPLLAAGHWMTWLSTGSPLNTMEPNPMAYALLPTPHATMAGVSSLHATHLSCHIVDVYGGCEVFFWPVEHSAVALDAGDVESSLKPIPYDLSAYQGLVFWGMSTKSNRVKIMINNADTDVNGGRCGKDDSAAEQCWDAFSKYVTLGDTWNRYEVKFGDLFQEGWGHQAASGKFDPTTVYSIAFQVNGPQSASAPAIDADFWIDDVYFEQFASR
jgi:hypothetical protein